MMECEGGWSLLPEQTSSIASDALDFDYNELWAEVHAAKYIEPDRVRLRMAHDGASRPDTATNATSTSTNTKEPAKGSDLYAEQMLHPRWIAIQDIEGMDEMRKLESFLGFRKQGDDEPAPLEDGLKTMEETIGALFVKFESEQSLKLDRVLSYLGASQAVEAHWEQRVWRAYFLKDIDEIPGDQVVDRLGHQIPQAKIRFDKKSQCVLPPLLARKDDRRESNRTISNTPWVAPPTSKQPPKRPDYLYALALKHLLELRRDEPRKKLDTKRIAQLPAVRHAQHACSPCYFMVEIKRSVDDEKAAIQYLAFLGAYTLHERLLLRLVAETKIDDITTTRMKIDDSFAVYLLTCCGIRCKVFKMQIRRKPMRQTAVGTPNRFEPVRYDLDLLEEIEIVNGNLENRQKLAGWINMINYYGSTMHFEALRTDVQDASRRELPKDLDNLAFVYSNEEGTEIQAMGQHLISQAYRNGELKPEGPISGEVIDYNEDGDEVPVETGAKFIALKAQRKNLDHAISSSMSTSSTSSCQLRVSSSGQTSTSQSGAGTGGGKAPAAVLDFSLPHTSRSSQRTQSPAKGHRR